MMLRDVIGKNFAWVLLISKLGQCCWGGVGRKEWRRECLLQSWACSVAEQSDFLEFLFS